MNPNLAGISIALVCLSVAMAIAANAVDRRLDGKSPGRRHTKSMVLMEPRMAIILFLTYAAIAFSQDLALEWLAAIALLCCAGASLARRALGALMARRLGKDGMAGDGEAPSRQGDDGTMAPGEESASVVAGHMAEMLADIVIWVSALDLILLFAMAFIEKVIPYYVGLAIG